MEKFLSAKQISLSLFPLLASFLLGMVSIIFYVSLRGLSIALVCIAFVLSAVSLWNFIHQFKRIIRLKVDPSPDGQTSDGDKFNTLITGTAGFLGLFFICTLFDLLVFSSLVGAHGKIILILLITWCVLGAFCFVSATIFLSIQGTEIHKKGEQIVYLVNSVILAVAIVLLHLWIFFPENIFKIFAIIMFFCGASVLTYCTIDKFIVQHVSFEKNSNLYLMILNIVTLLATWGTAIYLTFWREGEGDQALFSSVMGLFACTVGGIITYGGVAWTIRRQDYLHRREEKSKNKPMFRYCFVHENIEDYIIDFCFEGNQDKKSQNYFHFDYVFKNFDNAIFVLEYIIVNGIKMHPQFDANIEKNEYFILRGLCEEGKNVTEYFISVRDVLGNNYKFELLFDCGEPTMIREVEEK